MSDQEDDLMDRIMALIRNVRGRHRRRDVEQGGVQQATRPVVRWRPPTEQSLPGWDEHKRQADLQAQPGGYQFPQMVSGWLWPSQANLLMGGPYEYTHGGQVHYIDKRKPATETYKTFKNYDQISKNLRDLAPADKVVGPEDEERFRNAGIEFGGLIGGGSFGKVFHSTVTQPDGTVKQCVVKRLAFADFNDKNRSIRYATLCLVREMKVAQKIMDAAEQEERATGLQPSGFDSNKNIVGCNNIWRIYQENTQFPDPVISLLFLEACDTDLKHLIENPIPDNTKLTEDDARKLFVQICNALKWLHGLGIVHFDIKPDNIMIKLDPADSTRGQFKLGDFGLAEMFPDLATMQFSNIDRGTPLYKAPEVESKIHADRRRADIYMLGSTVLMSMLGFGEYKMAQGVLKAHYTHHWKVMDVFEQDLNIPLSQLDMNLLNRYGIRTHEIYAFFRLTCTENHNHRYLSDEALNSHWARRWQYQPGFVDLECLVARQQLLQQQPAPAPQQPAQVQAQPPAQQLPQPPAIQQPQAAQQPQAQSSSSTPSTVKFYISSGSSSP